MDGDFRGAPAPRPDRIQRTAGRTAGWHEGRSAAPRAKRPPFAHAPAPQAESARPDPVAPGAGHAAAPPPVGGAARALPAHDVRQLMGGGTQAVLKLDGVAYSLRITRAGKLILTK